MIEPPLAAFSVGGSVLTLFYRMGYCSLVSRIFLEENAIAYQDVEVRFQDGHLGYERLKTISPLGYVPLLLDGDFHMTESTAILRYLNANHAQGKGFPPEHSPDRARLDEWLSFYSSFFQFQFWTLYVPEHFASTEDGRRDVVATGKQELEKWWDIAESRLQPDQEWTLSWGFSPADAYALVFRMWSESQFQPQRWPRLDALTRRAAQRASVAVSFSKEGLAETRAKIIG